MYFRLSNTSSLEVLTLGLDPHKKSWFFGFFSEVLMQAAFGKMTKSKAFVFILLTGA